MSSLVIAITVVFLFGTYMFPWIIADARNSREATVIFWVNVLIGWVPVCWFLLLFWAMVTERRPGC